MYSKSSNKNPATVKKMVIPPSKILVMSLYPSSPAVEGKLNSKHVTFYFSGGGPRSIANPLDGSGGSVFGEIHSGV